MEFEIITAKQQERRLQWITEISKISGHFGDDSEKIAHKLAQERQTEGIDALLGHLRLCGAIPERYGHNTSEEKLYSKYTDIIIHNAYQAMGFTSIVLKERAGVADVECVTDEYSFVADAKVFRLSRTAKNQKDFKVQAMDRWKHGKPFAMIVCPIYQLPSRASQIYQQAAARSVYIATYSHLAVLANYAQVSSQHKARQLLHRLFITVEAMPPTKDAHSYWQAINRTLLEFDDLIRPLWRIEKKAVIESIQIARQEALRFLAEERERIMRLSKEDAIREILKASKIENKIRAIKSVSDNGLLGVG